MDGRKVMIQYQRIQWAFDSVWKRQTGIIRLLWMLIILVVFQAIATTILWLAMYGIVLIKF